MTRVVVNVMLKPEILDPQGEAIARALPRLGFEGVASVRQGKRFEIEFDDPADFFASSLEGAARAAEPLEDAVPAAESAEPTEASVPTEGAETTTVEADRTDALTKAHQIAETLLANPVIEDFEVRVLP